MPNFLYICPGCQKEKEIYKKASDILAGIEDAKTDEFLCECGDFFVRTTSIPGNIKTDKGYMENRREISSKTYQEISEIKKSQADYKKQLNRGVYNG